MGGSGVSLLKRSIPWIITVTALFTAWVGWKFQQFPNPQYFTAPIAEVYRPYKAPENPLIIDWTPGTTQDPIVVYKPNEGQIEAIEDEVGGHLPEGEILNAVDIAPLSKGGTAICYLEPVAYDMETGQRLPRKASVMVYPKDRGFFEYEPYMELGLYLGYNSSGDKLKLAEYTQGIARLGRVHTQLKLSWKDISNRTSSKSYWEAYIGGKVRF